MTSIKLIWQASPWYLILCVLISALACYLLYSKKSTWTRQTNYILAGLRFFLCLGLSILLLAPLLKILKDYFEKPIIVVAIDNSQSINRPKDTTYTSRTISQIDLLAKEFGKLPIDLKIISFQGNVDQVGKVKFTHPSSDISQLLQGIESDYSNKNLQGVILATDGIYNQGSDPSFHVTPTPVFTIGLGDTLRQKDIRIRSLSYNKVTFTGNKFPILAEVNHFGFRGKSISVTLLQNNKVLVRKTVSLKGDNGSTNVDFLVEASGKGLQHYVVQSEYLKEEFTKDNNIAHAYIEVLDNKEKILIAAASPHPDIKAIRGALEKNENYEITIFIAGVNSYKEQPYDLIVFYQVPSVIKTEREIFNKLLKKSTPALFVVGNQSNLNEFNALNKQITINARFGQTDNVTPSLNERFDKFILEPVDKERIAAYAPVMVPYGNFTIPNNANSDIILYQKIGNSVTSKPLLYFSQSNGVKTGVILGEGLWQWRLSEAMETNQSVTFDKLISNIVQLVSSKDDKRKFRCYPTSNEYSTYEPVLFETEVYNDIYEKTFNHNINLNIVGENKKVFSYSYINSQQSPRFEIKGLPEGVYKYEASTPLSGKVGKATGEFTIQSYNLEALNTTADHTWLKTLSSNTGGKYVPQQDMSQLTAALNAKSLKSKVFTTEELNEIVNLPWIFVLLLTLVSAEWFVRKYKGGY